MPNQPDIEKSLAARRAALRASLAAQRPNAAPQAGGAPAGNDASAMSMGMRAASEFIGAILVGAGIGWALDHWLGTSPGFSIGFFLLGVVAGVFNVVRATSPLPRAEAPAKDTPPLPRAADDDEDE